MKENTNSLKNKVDTMSGITAAKPGAKNPAVQKEQSGLFSKPFEDKWVGTVQCQAEHVRTGNGGLTCRVWDCSLGSSLGSE